MPVSYSKWDAIVDSDDEDVAPANDSLEKGPAMDEFLSLGRDASVAEIQEKIKNLPAATKEHLLRHEKGGLLQRMMGLDPTKAYEAGEIFGTAKPPSAAAPPPKKKSGGAPVSEDLPRGLVMALTQLGLGQRRERGAAYGGR